MVVEVEPDGGVPGVVLEQAGRSLLLACCSTLLCSMDDISVCMPMDREYRNNQECLRKTVNSEICS